MGCLLRSVLFCSGLHLPRFGSLWSVLLCSCAECLIVSQAVLCHPPRRTAPSPLRRWRRLLGPTLGPAPVGSYSPRWVALEAEGRRVAALTFVVRRDHPQYAGKLPSDEHVRAIATAAGAFGSTADYLERTRVALIAHGIVDPYLEDLAARITDA